jgi:surface polysaccharide O-acyltransferase-like enzyme
MTSKLFQRNYGLDILRVLACYMVIQVHTGEFYYIGANTTVLHTVNAEWVGWYNSLCRICVPMFVMLSGFFLFPVGDAGLFFKKRLSRVAVPFAIWCALYAFYQYFMGSVTLPAAFINILKITVNYGVEIGHLWYVYMLLGIYLFAPIISPWVQSVSKKGMQFYLALWGVSLTLPYLHLIFPEIWGEAFWNHTPMLYYFTGFMGYIVLAVYIKKYLMAPAAWNYFVGIALIGTGYAITAYGFLHQLPVAASIPQLEVTWGFETINVAMMTTGLFLLFKNVSISNVPSAINKLVFDVSAKSYGIYLAHIMVLNAVHSYIDPLFLSSMLKIPIIAPITFICTYLVIKALSYLPKSKWLIG